MIRLEEFTDHQDKSDILSKFSKRNKETREISSDMDVDTLSDIISDRLIEIVKRELQKIK